MNRGGKYLSLGFRAMNEQAGRTDLIYSNYSKRCLSLSLVKFNWRQTRQVISIKRPRGSYTCLTEKRIKVTQRTITKSSITSLRLLSR